MKQLIIEFLAHPGKTALVSVLSVLTGQTTEVIAQGTISATKGVETAPEIIQIIAYLAAISAGIISIANTLKAWYQAYREKNKILK